MGLVSSWEQKGIDKGKADLVARLLRRRFGADAIDGKAGDRFARLSGDQLDDLGEALLDFVSTDDLNRWLQSRSTAKRKA